jgi:lysophospholipase L1-like esterase
MTEFEPQSGRWDEAELTRVWAWPQRLKPVLWRGFYDMAEAISLSDTGKDLGLCSKGEARRDLYCGQRVGVLEESVPQGLKPSLWRGFYDMAEAISLSDTGKDLGLCSKGEARRDLYCGQRVGVLEESVPQGLKPDLWRGFYDMAEAISLSDTGKDLGLCSKGEAGKDLGLCSKSEAGKDLGLGFSNEVGISRKVETGKALELGFRSKSGTVAALLVILFGLQVGFAVGQMPRKPVAKAPAHSAVPTKKSGAKAVVRPGQHAAASSKAGKSKGHLTTSYPAGSRGTGHGRQGAGRYVAPPPRSFRPRYSAARSVQAPSTVVPQQVPSAQVQPPIPQTQVPAADAPGVAAQEVAPGLTDETAYADEVLPAASKQPFRYPQALDSFFKALSAEQSQRMTPVAAQSGDASMAASTVRILQFGDSHTAADIFTGAMRAQMQAKFGNGGLGFQYPGHPFAGYRLLGSSRSQTQGWVTQGNHFTDLGDGDTGLGGIAISTRRPGESVFLTTTCETLQVEYLRQPGGGGLDFSVDGQPVSEIKTGTDADASSERGAGTFTYSCSPGVHEFQLITLDSAPVRLLGLVTEQAGVTYECLGINGAVAPLILKWNQQMFADYLGQRSPNLIVLAYGTNEAAQSASHNDDYVAELHEVLQNLHRIVPGASILMLGPYDRALKVGRGRHAAWSTQAAIDRIIADQKEVCRVDGCAFYDERARMGGPGTMQRWAVNGLAQGDRTHLTGTGYRVLANALYRDLMTAYNSYLLTVGKSAPAGSP